MGFLMHFQRFLTREVFPALVAFERFQVQVLGFLVPLEILFSLITGAASKAREGFRRRVVTPKMSDEISFARRNLLIAYRANEFLRGLVEFGRMSGGRGRRRAGVFCSFIFIINNIV